MGIDIIPGMKHRRCGGAVYLDGEIGFFCKRCERKLSVPMHEVPRKMLRGTRFETRDATSMSTAVAVGYLAESIAFAAQLIISLLGA